MVNKTAILKVNIVTDAKPAIGGLDNTGASLARLEQSLNRATIPAAALSYAVIRLAQDAGQAASALEQAEGAVESVFGAQQDALNALAENSATAVGISESNYKQLAAIIGAQLKNMGIAEDQLAGQTDGLIDLGADLAATFGGTTADAVNALSSLLRGERDPIERYGVSIKQADIEARKAQLGLENLTAEEEKAADAQATLALLLEQTADASGQFARETESAAGAQQIATAQWEDAQAVLGEALLPYMVALSGLLSDVAGWAVDNSEAFGLLVGIIGGLAAAVLIANGALKTYQIVTGLATAAQRAFNIAATANPVGLVIAAIVLAIGILIGATILIIQNWEAVSRFGVDAWNGVLGAVNGTIDGIEDLINWVILAIDWLTKLGNGEFLGNGIRMALGLEPIELSTPEAVTLGRIDPVYNGTRGASTASSTTVIVQGAIDPDGTARTIRKALTGSSKANGTIPAAGALW